MANSKGSAELNKDSRVEKTFREVAEEWVEESKDRIASTTHDRYMEALERDVFPEYADFPMSSVTESEMNSFLKRAPELAKKQGRNLRNSGLMVVRAVMSSVIQYARKGEDGEKTDISYDVNSYEELTAGEIEMICLRAKYNHCTEMLSALLALFCGLRISELCALGCNDVDLDRMEIFVHRSIHRVKNPDRESDKKTLVVVEELSRKTQIRSVSIPSVMKDYIKEFYVPGRMLIRKNNGEEPADPRSLEGRLTRVMDAFRMENITYERLRKTYMNGSADEIVLTNVFTGVRPDRPYDGTLDYKWLSEEMANDLTPLRLLVGFSAEDMSKLIGTTEAIYQDIEVGNRGMSWSEYLSLLFVFHYNGRTLGIIDNRGLFPKSLKEKISIGEPV
ncbi:MAG: tyrosine-type recombinase/integrase [Oribacterium sp.]|nr:tyrosine-type recombinase/integrase [Oribacterium sp.]